MAGQRALRRRDDLGHGRRQCVHLYNNETADTLVAAQSWTRYDPLIAIPQLVEQFASRELRLTFFVPG